MQLFARLFNDLDQTNKTNEKVEVLKRYFAEAPGDDKLWALALFSGRRPQRQVNSTLLREWAAEVADIPAWLFEERYHVVGDLAETVALLLPATGSAGKRSLADWMEFLEKVRMLDKPEKKVSILDAWHEMGQQERFVFTKLITGAFRVGVSKTLVVRALSELYEIDKPVLVHRIMGNWNPQTITFEELIFEENRVDDFSRPYPFYLAYALDMEVKKLGQPGEWQAEWKWDGIRSQIVSRQGQLFIWSRGEDLVTEKFPELLILQNELPHGTAIDGEIVPRKQGQVLPFNVLQTRIGRKNVTKKILEEAPVAIIAYDLLEWQGEDMRQKSLQHRRQILEQLVKKVHRPDAFILSPVVNFSDWAQLAEQRKQARQYFTEGLMLKRLDSPYLTGRKRGDWWKWKLDPLSIDGVLVYAQRGHGRRANLFSDYTFAVWHGDKLVPFAKAYSGLSDKEMQQVDAFVKKNTIDKYGPVRTVKAELVFEIGFEGIQHSKRHKRGVALRFPRMLRWRTDKKPDKANTLEELQQLLNAYEAGEM